MREGGSESGRFVGSQSLYVSWNFYIFTFSKIDWLGRCARFVDQLAVRNVSQGSPLGGGPTLHIAEKHLSFY